MFKYSKNESLIHQTITKTNIQMCNPHKTTSHTFPTFGLMSHTPRLSHAPSFARHSKVSAVTSHARRGGPMPKLVFWFFVCHCLYVCLFEYTLLTACRLIVWSFVVDSLNVWTFDSLIVWMFNYSKCAQLISWTLQYLIDQTGADKHSTQTLKKPNGFF